MRGIMHLLCLTTRHGFVATLSELDGGTTAPPPSHTLEIKTSHLNFRFGKEGSPSSSLEWTLHIEDLDFRFWEGEFSLYLLSLKMKTYGELRLLISIIVGILNPSLWVPRLICWSDWPDCWKMYPYCLVNSLLHVDIRKILSFHSILTRPCLILQHQQWHGLKDQEQSSFCVMFDTPLTSSPMYFAMWRV